MSRRGRIARGLALALVALMLLSVIGVRALARAIVFPRGAARPDPSVFATPGLERWPLATDEGEVEAFFLPGRGASADRPAPAVVFTHGNAELIDHWAAPLARYRELGVSVVLPEYRGYGRSQGSPSEDAIAEDLRALQSRLRSDPRVDASRLVYHGRSLGGGAACALAATHPPAALVLESTFTSLPDVAAAMFVPGFLLPDRFDNRGALSRYRGPVLLFHGTRDTVIPVRHARELERAHARAELVLYDAGHNDLPPPGSDYWARIERHLRSAGVIAP
ncbi:MAG: alpha/beta hydrolase [Sandaracinaceae bacterium]|nr:alpha/beta hydrolase [Sandaracinaceae bacterium]